MNLAEAHIFNAIFHRWELHVRDIDSLCRFDHVDPKGRRSGFSFQEIEFYRRNNTVLSGVLAESRMFDIYFADDSTPLRRSNAVSGNYFGELGITPVYGRLLDEHDDQPGSAPVAMISYDFWQSRFGGEPGTVMTTIRLNGKPLRVVGIAPHQFSGLGDFVNLWIPSVDYGRVHRLDQICGNKPAKLADFKSLR